MTTLSYDAARFADDALAGLAAAHPELSIMDGGVLRTVPPAPGTVSVVIGGGSGHYPAFAGLVGTGLATAAACGNIFASPSAAQIHRVARASERGAGVLLAYGNYAGDVLHFGLAAQRLRAEGVDARTLAVTDDIASGGPDEAAKRRGVAGDLFVFKVAGAAAEAGHDLDSVVRLATRANERTRSLGVAFDGCTLPGSTEPLFTVPAGRMSVGLGIHGEPGIAEQPRPDAEQLAEQLVTRLLADVPADATGRAAVILNGLGTYKYEELFVLYGIVARRLSGAGVEIVAPAVGEFVTSLDMNGASLTLGWLDDQLDELWRAPASTPAFHRVPAPAATAPPTARSAAERTEPSDRRRADLAPAAVEILDAVRAMLVAEQDEFGRIDAIAGDGDHGIGMARGATAAVAAARDTAARGAGLGPVLLQAADGWAEHAGGTSGALWGVLLGGIGSALADAPRWDTGAIAEAAAAGLSAIRRLGGAEVGDKTMVDAYVPAVESLAAAANESIAPAAALAAAAEAAGVAAADTAALRPRLGRARPLAERSIGHPDAGAVSFARVLRVVADEVSRRITVRDKEMERQHG